MTEVKPYAQLRIDLKRMVILGGSTGPAGRFVADEQGFGRLSVQ